MTNTIDKTYNGWTNYETWNVKLWLDNDGEQEYWAREARKAKSPYDLGQAIKASHEENTPTVTGVYADLLNGALSEVNWLEIAESLIEDNN